MNAQGKSKWKQFYEREIAKEKREKEAKEKSEREVQNIAVKMNLTSDPKNALSR